MMKKKPVKSDAKVIKQAADGFGPGQFSTMPNDSKLSVPVFSQIPSGAAIESQDGNKPTKKDGVKPRNKR